MAFRPWTQRLRETFRFAWSAVVRGVERAVALIQIRRGGIEVSDEEWRTAVRAAERVEATAEVVAALPEEAYIPAWEFEPIDWDFRAMYNVIHEVRWYNPAVGDWVIQKIQVGSDELLTKRDWEALVVEWLEDYMRRGQYDPERGYEILSYKAVRRVY